MKKYYRVASIEEPHLIGEEIANLMNVRNDYGKISSSKASVIIDRYISKNKIDYVETLVKVGNSYRKAYPKSIYEPAIKNYVPYSERVKAIKNQGKIDELTQKLQRLSKEQLNKVLDVLKSESEEIAWISEIKSLFQEE